MILLGDCLDLMNDIPDGSVDMILTDLPYGTTKCSWDSPIDLPRLWEGYKRIIKPNGAICLFAQAPFDKVLAMSNMKMFRYEWIWEKGAASGALNAKRMPMKAHEIILVFYKKLPTYNPQMTHGHPRKVSSAKNRAAAILRTGDKPYGKEYPDKVQDYDSTSRYPRDVLKFSLDKQKKGYQAGQKPVALLEYLIKTYTNPTELVLDTCAGSGSTGEAAILTGRKYILMDNKPAQIERCKQRLKNLSL